MLYSFIFLFGLCVGSFLNVLIVRLGSDSGEGIGGRSYCPKCTHQLGPKDLIPLLSFILLRGRCRYCGQKISWQYPIVELVTGTLFVLIFTSIFNFKFLILNQFFNFSIFNLIDFIYLFFIVSCLIVIFVSDLKYFIIPDKIIIAVIIGFFVFKLFGILDFVHWNLFGIWGLGFGIWRPLLFALLSGIGASAFFFAVILATRGRGMGLGDAKLAFLMGLVLGWPQILAALLLAFVSGALVGLGLILAGRAKMKSEIPFGTFLAASTFLIMLLGEKILIRYINLII